MAGITGAGHKDINIRFGHGPMETVLEAQSATCAAGGIEAFCGHMPKEGEAAEKGGEGKKVAHAKGAHPKAAPPAAAPKPGGAAPPEDKRRFAKEENEAPKPAPARPGRPVPPPAKPAVKLVLQVVPTAAEDEKGASVKVSEIKKGMPEIKATSHSTEVGLVKHVAGTGEGDQVTIQVEKTGKASPCPKWIITDYGIGQSAAKKEEKSGTPLKHTFLPPNPAEAAKHIVQYPLHVQNPIYKMGWLDVVKPRHYTVVCTSPFPHPHAPAGHSQQTTAGHPQTPAAHKASPPAVGGHQPPGQHHTLEVDVYPSDKWTLKLESKKNGHKPAWEKALIDLKEELETLIHHATELANSRYPLIPTATIKLMEGDLSLSNFWEEEEGSNLVRWTAELEGKITFIDLTLTFGINVGKFIKAAENLTEVTKQVGKAVEKFEKHFEATTNVKAEASLSFIVVIKIAAGGKALWNKGEHSPLTASVKDLKVDLVAGLGLSGVLEVERIGVVKTDVLVKFTGQGTSEMTLSTSPRLESGGNLWLDNAFSWQPLKVSLKAEANKIDSIKDKKPPAKPGVTPPASKSEKPIPSLPSVDYEWSGDLFKEVKGYLKSLNLTTRTWGAPHALQHPITPKPNLPPRLTPAVKPLKPVAPP